MKISASFAVRRWCWRCSWPWQVALKPARITCPSTATTAPGAKPKKTYKDLIVGYAQLGAESEWRSANTESVKEAAAHLGVELKFSDAQQKQENQIKAIRSFIAQKVDVIGVAPLVETGWDDVFKEAKDAGIPIILVDRRADVPPDLYVTFMGSDFLEEGRNAARIMAQADRWPGQHRRVARYARFGAGQ